ncbi:MAG: DNA topoisomerase (ATP-hydrolyzing) subunit A [Clostridia bacterium]|jgi:DNA gyrase subunit A|nr:DNA topoisomerase (ATP-hydrolyzing) subunit A [Clostridia bacterium]
MSKKKNDTETIKNPSIFQQNIIDTLELNYMPYAMSVIVSRAIPEIDGFKPSHRKLLYTMYKMGLLTGARTKSSNVVGQTMHLNPHGDAAIYETMVRLTEGNQALLHPFVDSKGNFGKQYSRDMAYAAPRYTEVKLAPICNEIFADIDKNTVDFVDNYDATTKEPLLLPTTFPNILVNPNQGIAVGMASCICSFNLSEICDTAINLIKDKSFDIKKTLLAPDFSTGGKLLYDEGEIDKIYETGKGSIRMYSKYNFDKKNNCIEITEIPYTTNIESIIDKIISLVKSGKFKEITDIRDETDLGGLKIAIDVKKNTKVDVLMHKLFAQTPLSDTFSCNFNILIDGHPKTMGIKEILSCWTDFRIKSIKGQLAYDIEKKSAKLHLLEGLEKILADIDKAIAIIRHTELESMVIPNLMDGFQIDEKQAEYIAEIKLRNINKEYILNRIKELEDLKNGLKELNVTLNSEHKIKNIICSQLKSVSKKYGRPRMTEIITSDEIKEIPEEDFIEDYGIKLFLTKQNYFKKVSLVSLRTSGDHKLKDDDEIVIEEESTNRTEIIFFSDKQNVYKYKTDEINDTKVSSLGEYLPNILGMEEDENIIFFTATTNYEGMMFFMFENGKAVKIPFESYKTKTNRKKLVKAYSEKSRLIFMTYINEDSDFIITRDDDNACLFNTSLISLSSTRTASGVQVYTLKKNSKISNVYPVSEFESDDIEFYRINKIPSRGHFLKEDDKKKNNLSGQISI